MTNNLAARRQAIINGIIGAAKQVENNNLIILKDCCRQMEKANLFIIKQAISHQSPFYRFAAAREIGRRKYVKYHEELIELLSDPDDYVQQIARWSLKRLTKKDFGPLPGARADQIAECMEKWRECFHQ